MANKVGELAKCRSKRSDEIYACVPLRVRNRMPYLDVFYHKLEYLPLSLSLSLSPSDEISSLRPSNAMNRLLKSKRIIST